MRPEQRCPEEADPAALSASARFRLRLWMMRFAGVCGELTCGDWSRSVIIPATRWLRVSVLSSRLHVADPCLGISGGMCDIFWGFFFHADPLRLMWIFSPFYQSCCLHENPLLALGFSFVVFGLVFQREKDGNGQKETRLFVCVFFNFRWEAS